MCSELVSEHNGTIEPLVIRAERSYGQVSCQANSELGLPQEVFKLQSPLLIAEVQWIRGCWIRFTYAAAGFVTYLGLPMVVK